MLWGCVRRGGGGEVQREQLSYNSLSLSLLISCKTSKSNWAANRVQTLKQKVQKFISLSSAELKDQARSDYHVKPEKNNFLVYLQIQYDLA